MSALVAAGGVGGFVVLLAALVGVGRGIFRQVNATEDNTRAVTALTEELARVKNQVGGQEVRLAVLEDRAGRNGVAK